MAPYPATVYSSKGSLKLKSGHTLGWTITLLTDTYHRVTVTLSDGGSNRGVSHVYQTKNECLMWVDEMIYVHNQKLPRVIP